MTDSNHADKKTTHPGKIEIPDSAPTSAADKGNLSPTQQRAERAEEIAEQRSHSAPAPDNEDAR